jgi:hypothetical protein
LREVTLRVRQKAALKTHKEEECAGRQRLRSEKPEDIQDAEGDGRGGDKIDNVTQRIETGRWRP